MRTNKDKDLDYNFNLTTGLYLRKKTVVSSVFSSAVEKNVE